MIKEIKLSNLGTANKNKVIITTDKNSFELYFSYETLVCVWYRGHKTVIENLWSTTTGKLLNDLEPDKKQRLNREDFDKEVNLMMRLINA